jgi:3-oxoacyl-[acyl-carrier-protein] synthase II
VGDEEARRLSRICRLSVAAARLALEEARVDPTRGLGLVIGTEFGDLASTMDFADGYLGRGPAGLSALLFPSTVMNTMAATTAIAVGAREAVLTLNAADVAGELAVARAASMVAAGRAAAVLAGGVDELDPRVLAALDEVGAAPGVRGEGAAFVVLEPETTARARGACVLGEIDGVACGAVPARPHGVGRRARSHAVARALQAAGTGADRIGWVYASASGDDARDAWEQRILESALAPWNPPTTSLAALAGHHSGLGVMRVGAAAWTAAAGLLPVTGAIPGAGGAVRGRRVRPGPGLVHGLARGGTHVTLVVGQGRAGAR